MAKRKSDGRKRAEVLDLLYGGEPLPGNLKKKPLIVRPDEAFAEGTRLHKQGAALRNKLALPAEPLTAAQKKTAAELRALTDKLSRRKPFLPPSVDLGGVAYGSYTTVLTPPYASMQAVTGVVAGEPDVSSSVNPDTGEMRCKVVTSNSDLSNGSAAAYLATYFRPTFNTGTVSIHVDMDIDFAWWVNSIGSKDATSRAQGLMRVYKANTFNILGQAAYLGWSISKSHELDFNFGTYPSPSWSFTLPVTRTWYQFVLSLECSAAGVGWIGSIAGSQVSQRVRSVRFAFHWNPQAQAAQ